MKCMKCEEIIKAGDGANCYVTFSARINGELVSSVALDFQVHNKCVPGIREEFARQVTDTEELLELIKELNAD